MKIILASQSEARKHALKVLGLSFQTIPSNLDETTIKHPNPLTRARLLSEAKAKTVGEKHPNALIISADMFVVHRNSSMEKPKNKTEAMKMLKRLSRQTFRIIGGLCVYNSKTAKTTSATTTCQVTFRKLSQHEIMDYVKRYPVTTFSAAFNGDGLLRFAKKISGEYNFRTGLSVNRLVQFLREHGVMV